jgi:ATP-dependent Lhr-like helicase
MQLILHAPFGGRINKAWGLALRKRFCRGFNFELQASATDNGLNISLAEQHSFPLSDVFRFLTVDTVTELLQQASLTSPIFKARWRWDAGRSLQLLRMQKGKRVPPQIQRTRGDDLLASVFPSVAACQENIEGDIEIPNHPLVREVMKDVLQEAMDLEGLKQVLAAIESGAIQCVAVDTTTPSAFAHELLNANPYAYLDDAPQEERRARAVNMRGTLPDHLLGEAGRLDPAAIAQVREECWPDIRDEHELHDLLYALVIVPASVLDRRETRDWPSFMERLASKGRASIIESQGRHYLVANEHQTTSDLSSQPERSVVEGPASPSSTQPLILDLSSRPERSVVEGPASLSSEPKKWVPHPCEPGAPARVVGALGWEARVGSNNSEPLTQSATNRSMPLREASTPVRPVPVVEGPAILSASLTDEPTLRKSISAWMNILGPATANALADFLGLAASEIFKAFLAMEMQGSLLRGIFESTTPPNQDHDIEWCERRLLQRIHKRTLATLRKQIEAVTPAVYMRWLLQWQHLALQSQLSGEAGVLSALRQLEGFEAPAIEWETSLLPQRVRDYDPRMLDALCLSGVIGWGRISPHPAFASADNGAPRRVVPTSMAPITFFLRDTAQWMDLCLASRTIPESVLSTALSELALKIRCCLENRGAIFSADLVRMLNAPAAEISRALWELVAAGLVTADGYDSLRMLIDPRHKKVAGPRTRNTVGRWCLLHSNAPESSAHAAVVDEEQHTSACWTLLARYGIVFRDLLTRETTMPRWRDLQPILRRLEAQGQLRGGRFISGFSGEQFALPEAVESLRESRRQKPSDAPLTIAAADPMNLIGIVIPGDRPIAIPGRSVTFRNGQLLIENQEQPTTIADLHLPALQPQSNLFAAGTAL